MNKAEKTFVINRMQSALDALRLLPDLTPCKDCVHFLAGYCEKWQAEVPVDAQPDGCEDWDHMPF
jgi:hypothetical protein